MIIKLPKLFSMLVTASLALAGAGALAGCGNSDAENLNGDNPSQDMAAVRTVQVETTVVEPVVFEDMIALIGVLESPRDAVLSAQSTGTLLTRRELGEDVRTGDVLAQVDAVLIKAALDQANANLASAGARAALAEDTFRRQQPLYADSIISALEFEQLQSSLNAARADLNQAEALVAQAEKQYENTLIRAPFNGRIEEVYAEEGEQVMPGSQIVRLVDTDNLKLRAGVPERYAIDIKKGTPVEVVFKAYGVGSREGVISFVGSVIDPQNRSFAIEVALTNREGTLKPEMVADLFVRRSVLENRLVVPQTAILRDENGSSVYVVERTSGRPTARLQQVELGAAFGGRTVVTSGLDDGDEVIVVGQTNVSDGDAVQTVANET